MKRAVIPVLLLLAGCVAEPPEDVVEPPTPPLTGDDDDATGDDDDATAAPCAPALALTPSEAWAVPGETLVTLLPSGGTGAWELALTTDASGAQFNPEYGTYLAGDGGVVDDVVTLTDAGCEGSATATIHVVAPMEVSPTTVMALPGTGFDLLVAAGSGDYSCALTSGDTGGSVTPGCRYDGGGEGTDTLRVEDLRTGQTVDVTVTLDDGAVLSARPERVWIPVGGTWELTLDAGSGWFTATPVQGTSVVATERTLEAVAPGLTTLSVVDDFTGQTATVSAWGVEALEGGFPRAGDNFITGASASPGDLDGDGWADVILSIEEADFGDYNTGAVHVFAGQDGGLAPSPVQTLSGSGYDERFGTSLHVADLTGDGEPDLLVGTRLADLAGTNSGAVALYPGVPGGFFEPTATRTWTGDHTYDYVGSAVTTCDFNGDGWEDLAIGAPTDEDRSVSEIAYDQGGIWLFLGGPNGLPDQPHQRLRGVMPDGGGGWIYAEQARLGSALGAGDVNGDGLCDLVVGGFEFNPPGESGSDGAVLVFPGTDASGSSTAVLSEPVAAWAGLEADSRDSHFGRALDVADADGDGVDDILVGQYRHHVAGLSGQRHGAVRLFLGDPAWTAPVTDWAMPSTADWSGFGDNGYDGFGWSLRMRDLTADGAADVLVGAYSDEVPGGPGGTGTVVAWLGLPGDVPAPTPTAWFAGPLGGDLYGTRVEPLPDMDGDGLADLFVYAARAEHHGIHVGTPMFHSTALGAAPVPLDNPGDSAGQRAGEAVAVLGDLDGDGFEEVAVGVPEYDAAGNRINSGMVQVFAGQAGGVQQEAWEIIEFERTSDGDRWGWGVAPGGDFDGDGRADLAVLGRYEDRPGSFSSAYVGSPSCSDSSNNQGGVAIFTGHDGVLPTSPSFLWWGVEPGDSSRVLVGGFDIDGDGFSDLAVGGMDWDDGAISNAGGFEVIHGRPADPGGIVVICNDGDRFLGPESSARMGQDLAPLGDVDGDGCDELAIGAYDEDHGYSNQGVTRVLWGYGPGCGATSAEVSVLIPNDSNARAGYSLDGGRDVDGDGVPDLVVGGYSRSTNGNQTGAAWLVPGWYLQTLTREPLVSGQAPTTSNPIVPPSGGPWTLVGTVQDEHFGRSVALVPGLGPGGRAGVAVGAPRADLSGVERTGGVRLHRWDPAVGGLDPTPWGAFAGESFTPNGRVGERIAAGAIAGTPALAVGGFRASSWGPAQGAAWLVPLAP